MKKTDVERIATMLHLKHSGMSYADIGNKYHISRQRVHQLISADAKLTSTIAMVEERAGGKCEICGTSEENLGRNLDFHHIDTSKGLHEYNNTSNLIAVYIPCHRQIHATPDMYPQEMLRTIASTENLTSQRIYKWRKNKQIGTLIKIGRTIRGLKQGSLAEQVGVSQPYLCEIERGRATPGWHLSVRIWQTLAITADIEELARQAIKEQL